MKKFQWIKTARLQHRENVHWLNIATHYTDILLTTYCENTGRLHLHCLPRNQEKIAGLPAATSQMPGLYVVATPHSLPQSQKHQHFNTAFPSTKVQLGKGCSEALAKLAPPKAWGLPGVEAAARPQGELLGAGQPCPSHQPWGCETPSRRTPGCSWHGDSLLEGFELFLWSSKSSSNPVPQTKYLTLSRIFSKKSIASIPDQLSERTIRTLLLRDICIFAYNKSL